MYSYEKRIKAVKLYIQYDYSFASVINELGYPNSSSLRYWYQEYAENGDLHKDYMKKPKFSPDQRKAAINHYLEHGKCVSRTVKALGYPSRPLLTQWIHEDVPSSKQNCRRSKSLIQLTQEEKEKAVIDMCVRTEPANKIAATYGVTRGALYNWKRQLLTEEGEVAMTGKTFNNKSHITPKTKEESIEDQLLSEKENLLDQVEELKQEVHKLRLERDILEKAAEVIKKDEGINLRTLNNRDKAIVINALRDKYRLKDLLVAMSMAKSSYCYQSTSMRKPDKYDDLRAEVRKVFEESSGNYGYRRIHCVIKNGGEVVSEKVIRRLIKEEHLTIFNVKRKKYNSYKGEISPEVENIVARDFHADKPNEKWLTDLTEFHIPAGKIYLSPMIDCFDGLPVSWTIGTSPDAELVNTMLDDAISTLGDNEHPLVHSDRGCHYRWPGWIERIDAAQLIRSMSKKGCSPDNAACEGFFGRLKNEMFYGHSWRGVSIEQFMKQLDDYIRWYAGKRIKISLGGMSPLDYRRSLGLVS